MPLRIQSNFVGILSTVKYEITSKEVRDSYWYMLKIASKYRKSILKHTMILHVIPVIIEFIFNKSITSYSIILGVILSLSYPIYMAYMATAIAKRGRDQYHCLQTVCMFQWEINLS